MKVYIVSRTNAPFLAPEIIGVHQVPEYADRQINDLIDEDWSFISTNAEDMKDLVDLLPGYIGYREWASPDGNDIVSEETWEVQY
jgi:hypothetical protein